MRLISTLKERLSPDRRDVVITVLGARSGTSALAGTLGLLGGTLPNNLMAANFANAKGYFEPQDLANIHDEILASVGSSWNDWREFPPDWFSSAEAQRAQEEIVKIYRANFRPSALAILKEPRMCRILPLWHRVFKELELRPTFWFIDRSPIEVAKSLHVRDGSSIEQGLRYYIRNHLDAERDTRPFRRFFMSYDDLLLDWRKAIGAASKSLSVSLKPITAHEEEVVDLFLEQDLRHLNQSESEYKDEDLYHIALDVHYAYQDLAYGAREILIRRKLDQIRFVFDNLSVC